MMRGLLLCLVLVASVATAQEPDDFIDLDTSGNVEDPDLVRGVRAVAERLELLRGMTLDVPPNAIRAPRELREVAAKIRVASSIDLDQLAARGRAWQDVGLGSAASPAWLYQRLAEDVEGFTPDTVGHRIMADPGRLSSEDFAFKNGEEDSPALSLLMATGLRPDEPIIAHVLIHLLQIERDDRVAFPATTDALLAERAWSEGEANIAAGRFLFDSVGVPIDALGPGLDIGNVLEGRLVTPALGQTLGVEHDLLEWVYLDGFDQSVGLYRQGGWAALSDAMRGRRTTRDIVHLDRPPLTVRAFETPSSGLSSEFDLIDQDTIGEAAIAILVSHRTDKVNLGLISADGWAGDALFRWERPSDREGATLWITRWVSDEEAADFEYGYLRALERWTGTVAPEPEEGAVGRRFSIEDRWIHVTREGREVRVRVTPTVPEPPRAGP
jgi:hypothetical protein